MLRVFIDYNTLKRNPSKVARLIDLCLCLKIVSLTILDSRRKEISIHLMIYLLDIGEIKFVCLSSTARLSILNFRSPEVVCLTPHKVGHQFPSFARYPIIHCALSFYPSIHPYRNM